MFARHKRNILASSAALLVLSLLQVGAQAADERPQAAAERPRQALVIGNSAYGSITPTPGCMIASRKVSAALKRAGFSVQELEDSSSGTFNAAVADYAKRLADAPGATSVIYFCGHGVSFNNRTFLMPVSATVTREFDILTQGMLARSLLNALKEGHAQSGVVLLDMVPMPGTAGSSSADLTAPEALPAGFGLLASVETKLGDASTALAEASTAQLAGTTLKTAAMVDTIKERLSGVAGLIVAAHRAPLVDDFLIGGPPPAPKPVAAAPELPTITVREGAPSRAASADPSATIAPPPAPFPPAPAAVAVAPPSASPIPAPTSIVLMPEESQMSDADRRSVQQALLALGYYDGKVDGTFGSGTRAAIRRYQHEIGATMTGRITGVEAGRLLAGHKR